MTGINRSLLAPFELLYGSVVRNKNARYDKATPQRLQFPVVSIGNLSIGGSGKTPLVICLTRLIEREGFHPDVLSRGYGRSSRKTERVAKEVDVERFGDEPCMIAQATGVPVFVGADRYEVGLLAEREIPGGPGHVHLLDDGFQHRRLARAVDVVMVHPGDIEDRLLPRGRLREPLESLKRADVIVLRREDAMLQSALRSYAGNRCRFWHFNRRLVLPGRPRRAIAFCAIARPGEFFRDLEAAEMEMVGKISFRDHHRYTLDEIGRLAKLGERLGCDAFVTTQKDAIKLNAALEQRLTAIAPLQVAQLSFAMEDEGAVIEYLKASPATPPDQNRIL